ncbi:glycosyltransferase family 24 protein [Thelephora ganbajun]|uniref:Glycosyltransferase family 24 protein n=1 Tax=Thelephora ganbajun TaxID=370292 RepID=A0ACB6ZGJ7_THEGA|nr:glycosyltransferase family 24 protein [Thelephora ganbajun]
MRLLRVLLHTVPVYLAGAATLSPPVKVTVETSWPASPPLLEILESISTENEHAFFPLLDTLTDPNTPPSVHTLTAEAIHGLAVETTLRLGLLPKAASLAFADINLALHVATPKIEAFYQHYADHHGNKELGEGCESWVDWYGQVVCDLETLEKLADVDTIDEATSHTAFPRPHILPFDHVYPPGKALKRPPRTAIFYASVDSKNFRNLHSHLHQLATSKSPRIEYVLRYVTPKERDSEKKATLSGYGIALDLKRTDYLALDDRHLSTSSDKEIIDTSLEGLPSAGDLILDLLQAYPTKVSADHSKPLTSDELSGFAEIGIQAAQLLSDSRSPLVALEQLSQNFPKYASSVARRVNPKKELKEEIGGNARIAQPGLSAIWLNGLQLQETQINPLSLLKVLRQERDIMSSLTSLGLTPEHAVELVSHESILAAQREGGAVEGIFDASDREEGGDVIVWWNNIEKDQMYAPWSDNMQMLLRPIHPREFHSIKRNIFNIITIVDITSTNALGFVSATIMNLINRGYPFRFGLIPIVETEGSLKMARLLYWLNDAYGTQMAMMFLRRVSTLVFYANTQQTALDLDILKREFAKLLMEEKPLKAKTETDFDFITTKGTDIPLEKIQQYTKRLGISLGSTPDGEVFINGKPVQMSGQFLQHLQVEIGSQIQYLQEQLYLGTLSNDIADMSVYFYDLPTSRKRRNKLVYPSGMLSNAQLTSLPQLFEVTGFKAKAGSYLQYPECKDTPLVTSYVIADFDTEDGLSLLREAVESLEADSSTRIAFLHNPANIDDIDAVQPTVSILLSHLHTQGLFSSTSPSELLAAVGLAPPPPRENESQTTLTQESVIDKLTKNNGSKGDSKKWYRDYVLSSSLVAREIGLRPGQQALIVNGRVVGPFSRGDMIADDLKGLTAFELKKRAQPVVDALKAVYPTMELADRDTYSNIVAMATSVISTIQLPDPDQPALMNTQPRFRRRGYLLLDGNHTRFTFGGDSTAIFNFGVVLDPLSESAQKWSSLLLWLLNIPGVSVDLRIHPNMYTEVPLKRFYRYNLRSSAVYDHDGQESASHALFTGLPLEPIYTLATDVPQAWLVRPRQAPHDLDNIQLYAIPSKDRAKGIHAIFGLDYLVIEGHARDTLTSTPPRGLQLQLMTNDSTVIADTQVVANLGYLQFRAKPGVFRLEIRPGRGREVFTMESVGNNGWNSPNVEEVGSEITLTSFDGVTLYPRMARIPGMEREDVLPPPDTAGGPSGPSIMDRVSSCSPEAGGGSKGMVSVKPQADINIFTVASGLLYEAGFRDRFASIMILSVLRNTNSTVKFWFIENFLSPSFLEFIPHFAQEYGFQYELVTYKWPSWLRAQKEKQRIIWAYKILFLDVLFPMDLKKVIFVDADQIVRTDLKELVDLDLHGAPYGYTPMGDDNVEMEGFRFWKTGYWAQFLQGLPYHISALYVVDLVRFRQMAAGDMLRGHYQQLSADPNSLANLDQDLPNNLQRDVPIFSLPEDWLWCETWCSKDRLDRAKTIDLCQNPLTKEPKLARARKIPEWEEYDSEIAKFAQQLSREGRLQSDIAAADSNVLASAAAGTLETPPEGVQRNGVEEGERVRDEL